MRRFGMRVFLAALSPAVETGKERLHAGVRRMSMKFVGGMPAHEVLGFEPDTLVPDRAPE